MPYVLGLSNSPLLGGQSDLWKGIGDVCGPGFQKAISVQAGSQALASAGERRWGGGVGFGGGVGAALALGTIWLVQS